MVINRVMDKYSFLGFYFVCDFYIELQLILFPQKVCISTSESCPCKTIELISQRNFVLCFHLQYLKFIDCFRDFLAARGILILVVDGALSLVLDRRDTNFSA